MITEKENAASSAFADKLIDILIGKHPCLRKLTIEIDDLAHTGATADVTITYRKGFRTLKYNIYHLYHKPDTTLVCYNYREYNVFGENVKRVSGELYNAELAKTLAALSEKAHNRREYEQSEERVSVMNKLCL